VLCSVDQPEAVLQQIFDMRPAASSGIWSTSPALALAAAAAAGGRDVWPRLSATVIRTADNERAIDDDGLYGPTDREAGLEFHAWVPMPVSEW